MDQRELPHRCASHWHGCNDEAESRRLVYICLSQAAWRSNFSIRCCWLAAEGVRHHKRARCWCLYHTSPDQCTPVFHTLRCCWEGCGSHQSLTLVLEIWTLKLLGLIYLHIFISIPGWHDHSFSCRHPHITSLSFWLFHPSHFDYCKVAFIPTGPRRRDIPRAIYYRGLNIFMIPRWRNHDEKQTRYPYGLA